MPPWLEVHEIRLVLPVLDVGAVRPAADELPVDGQVEALVGGDVEEQRLVALGDIELLPELQEREGAVDVHHAVAVLLPVVGVGTGRGRLHRRPDPRGVVDRLAAEHVGAAAGDVGRAEGAADAPLPFDGVHRRGAELVGAARVHPLRTVRALARVDAEQLRGEDESLQVGALAVEVEVGTVEERAAVGRELRGGSDRDDLQSVARGEAGVGAVQAAVHLDLVEAELLQPLVPVRIAPGLLHHALCLRREAADEGDEVARERLESLRLPAQGARLLDGHHVPLVERERVRDVGAPVVDGLGAVDVAVEAVGLEVCVGRGDLDVPPVALERAAADEQRGEVERGARCLGDVRHLLQVADREAVPDHQHLEGFLFGGRGGLGGGGERRHGARRGQQDDFLHVRIIP